MNEKGQKTLAINGRNQKGWETTMLMRIDAH